MTMQQTVTTQAARSFAPDHTVLVVEEARDLIDSTAPFLIGEGYRVLPTQGPDAAIQLFKVFAGTRAAVLLIDRTVLERGGAGLVQRFREIDPALPIIVRSEVLTPNQRRRLVRAFDLHAVHDRSDSPERLLELVDSALATARRVTGARAEQDLHGLIMAKLCHDLRSSLHVIQGYTEVLRLDPTTAPVEDILVRLNGASESAVELAQGYLDLSCLEALGGGLRRELVSVDALVEDVRAGARRQIGERALQFTTIVPFSGRFIRTDEEKLRAVLAELVVHTIRRLNGGEIVFAVDFAPDRTDFIVRDDRRRLHSTAPIVPAPFGTRTQEWMEALPTDGIGLAIALRLSALLGASLVPGRGDAGGSLFTLSVPSGAITQATAMTPTLH